MYPIVNRCLTFVTASMVVLGEKLGGEPVDQSIDMLEIVSGVLFLESSRIRPTLLMATKRLPFAGTVHRKRMSGVRGLTWKTYMSCVSVFPLYGVHQFKSLRLSDMNNRLFVGVST
jgi:hypothetical protein